MAKTPYVFSNRKPLTGRAAQKKHERNLRHAYMHDIPLREYSRHRRVAPIDVSSRAYDTRSKTLLTGVQPPNGYYPSSSYSGCGAYKSKRRGRGRRVGFERVLNKHGGREFLSRQYWADHPSGSQPWWATRNPRQMVVEELATVQQHNPATAHAIGQAIGAAFGSGGPLSFPNTGLPTPIRLTRQREPLGVEELDPDPGLNSSRRLY